MNRLVSIMLLVAALAASARGEDSIYVSVGTVIGEEAEILQLTPEGTMLGRISVPMTSSGMTFVSGQLVVSFPQVPPNHIVRRRHTRIGYSIAIIDQYGAIVPVLEKAQHWAGIAAVPVGTTYELPRLAAVDNVDDKLMIFSFEGKRVTKQHSLSLSPIGHTAPAIWQGLSVCAPSKDHVVISTSAAQKDQSRASEYAHTSGGVFYWEIGTKLQDAIRLLPRNGRVAASATYGRWAATQENKIYVFQNRNLQRVVKVPDVTDVWSITWLTDTHVLIREPGGEVRDVDLTTGNSRLVYKHHSNLVNNLTVGPRLYWPPTTVAKK